MKRYSKEHDAYFDNKTNVWLESTCSDKTCEFCKNRPNKPIKK